ncbi:MAG: LuxR C-terminal-related transcriptional regulator [Actinomycetia bacterium]|nr:LuxR C-terminal-related transcriptional regulator [Actinomycetes bacterium]
MAASRNWPFVGREALVVKTLERLNSGHHIILAGAAGLGKTRLAGEVATRMLAKRVVVHRVAASPASAHLPLAPFAALIASESTDDIVGAVLRSLGADGRAGAGDPLLVVDDMHLLDDASAAVLQQVLLTGHVRLLGTLRTTSELPAAVSRLRQEADVATIDVPPLSDDDITTMVEHALGGTLDGRSHQLLITACAGNPMYARELVEGSLAAGTLRGLERLWSFDGELAATPLLEEVVLARLAPLSTNERGALELFAIAGQLPHRLVQQIVDGDTLEHLERKQVVKALPTEGSQPLQLDVTHPLYRELTRARLGALARMRIYQKLALAMDAIAAGGEPSPATAESIRDAMWHIRGEVEIAPEKLLTAARGAVAMGDSPLAAELAQVGYRRGGQIEAALLASWCLAEIGRHDEAIDVLKDAADHALAPWEQAAMRLRVAEELWWTSRQQAATAYLNETDLPAGPWHDFLDAQRGVFAMLDGDLPEAWRLCRPLIDHPYMSVRLVAAIAVGNAGINGDSIDEAMQVCGAAVAAVASGVDNEVGHLGDTNLHLAIQLVAMLHGGEVAAAAEFAEAGYASTIRQPSMQVRAWAAMLCGQALAIRGDIVKASRYLAEAERGWVGVGLQGFAGWCSAGLARAQAELGRNEESLATLRRFEGYNMSGFHLNEVLLDIGRAWVAAASGNRATAAKALAEAIERATRHEQWTHVAEAWHEAARLELLDVMDGLDNWPRPRARLAAARFDFVHACRSKSVRDLEAAVATFESLGAVLYAAEAAAVGARVARSSGAAKESMRLDGMAGRLLALCGTVRTPLLAGRDAGPLSPREGEVARLVALGLTNREIATQLVIGERTVENHIYRIFIKLGVDARDQIAEVLNRS